MSSRKKIRPTKVVFIIDKSSSMSPISVEMGRAINSMIDSLRGKASELAIVNFADNVGPIRPLRKMSLVGPYTNLYCYGNTALFDGIGAGIELLGDDKNVNYLVIAFTDGENNCSTKYNASTLKKLIDEKEAKNNWTITIQVPHGKRDWFSKAFGISPGNISEWENSSEGTELARKVTTQSIGKYFDSVARGQTKVQNFYNVDIDMADVTSKDVKNQLVDYKDMYKILSVDREEAIRDFVERKAKKNYVIGNCYYEVTKPEKVQSSKLVLIMEKGKPNIFGGNLARNLIGLPNAGLGDSKINPINLSKYHIFIQSTSVNRKLVRGSKLLIRK